MAAKATPPAAVVGANLAGLSLPDIVQYATLAYVLIMALHMLWKWRREYRAAQKEDGESSQ